MGDYMEIDLDYVKRLEGEVARLEKALEESRKRVEELGEEIEKVKMRKVVDQIHQEKEVLQRKIEDWGKFTNDYKASKKNKDIIKNWKVIDNGK